MSPLEKKTKGCYFQSRCFSSLVSTSFFGGLRFHLSHMLLFGCYSKLRFCVCFLVSICHCFGFCYYFVCYFFSFIYFLDQHYVFILVFIVFGRRSKRTFIIFVKNPICKVHIMAFMTKRIKKLIIIMIVVLQ